MAQTRINFGKIEDHLEQIDLTFVQRESWQNFLDEGIAEELAERSPIDDFTGKNWRLILENPQLGDPVTTVKQAQKKGVTYASPLKVDATLVNKKTGKEYQQEVFMGEIPQMTKRGTFVINGIERAVINQLVRSPGAYFTGDLDTSTGRMLHKVELRPLRGSWLEFEVGKNDVIVGRIDRRRKLVATLFLRALGIETDSEIKRLFGDTDTDKNHRYIDATLAKDSSRNREDALLEIYRKLRPGEPAIIENAETLFEGLFFDPKRYDLGKVGRYKLNKRLGQDLPNEKENWILKRGDIVDSIDKLIALQNGVGRVDDIDHLSNRRLRRVGELVAVNAFRVGLLRLERSVKEKMSLISPEDRPQPSLLVNARPLIASLNEFFRSSQLSSILDDTNPLCEIDVLRKVTVVGPGGVNRERASFSIRDVNASQYGRIDPVKTPEGPSIGLVSYLAIYTKVNEYGFLEAPYRKVEKVTKGSKTKMKVTDEVIYMTADDEQNFHITHADVDLDANGYITNERVPFRFQAKVLEGDSSLIDFIDLTPRQVVGVSAALIPFLANDEGNRALMGSNMQGQAVPLVQPDSPVVGTGMEGVVAKSMGRTIHAVHAGTVEYSDSDKIIVKLDKKADIAESDEDIEIIDGGEREQYNLVKFKRTSRSTCYNQVSVAKPGEKVKKGSLLADGPACEGGELALGKNLVIAYMSFEGYGFEDSILISERLVKQDLMTSIHIEEYESEVVDTKLGEEEVTKDIPNVGEDDLKNLAADGVVVVGAEVGPNDILVGKIAPKGETELTSEERLLRAIFGEKAREVRDTSLRVPHGERGIVVDVMTLDRDRGDELGPGVLKKVIVRVAQMRKIEVGDKVAGRHGNKGVIVKVMPLSDMPYLPDGTPVDIIISPLSVLARMNLGQLLETHLGWALNATGRKAALPVFDKFTDDLIVKELEAVGLPANGKSQLYDGRTGEPFMEKTVVGVGYMLKLSHMVEDKVHARSTGPYSLVTQQPLGGKAQMGGQRLGEMEVWGLEAHRAAYTLQEMLTIKSDDILGRARAFEAIVKGQDMPDATVPESFRVLIRELNSLGLNIEAQGATFVDEDEEEGLPREAHALAETLEVKDAVVASEILDVKSPMEVEEVVEVKEN